MVLPAVTKIALNTDAKSVYMEKQNIKLAKNQTVKDRVKKLLTVGYAPVVQADKVVAINHSRIE
ncbi:MAG: hypothetical protein P4M12_05785 [Gammaproteobacteria bacterium]|nr:hypothetical protein [Gammaproteobacteria bacterium]